jgi:lauroyl/myristoyl acyltransferase
LLATLSYARGSRVLARAASSGLFQRVFFGDVRRAMACCKEKMGLDQSVTQLARDHIVSSSFDPWRIRKLALMEPGECRRWTQVRNMELLTTPLSEGRGVLLITCHAGMSRALPLLMERGGIPVTTLEADSYYGALGFSGERYASLEMRRNEGFYLKLLFQAKKQLQKGGVLLMAPDGKQGMGEGNEFPFLERKRMFYGGFAALAEQTGAVVIWATVAVEDDGHVVADLQTLPTPAGLPAEEARDRLLNQYVNCVESTWRSNIARINVRHIEDHFAY